MLNLVDLYPRITLKSLFSTLFIHSVTINYSRRFNSYVLAGAKKTLFSLRRAACRAAVLPRGLAAPVMKADDAHTRNRAPFSYSPLQFQLQFAMLNFNLGVAGGTLSPPAVGLAGPDPSPLYTLPWYR